MIASLGKAVRRLQRLRRKFSRDNYPIVLMYHRIGEPAVDPWQLSVSPERFERQIDMLKSEREIVPLDWLVGRLRAGARPANAAAVTFDDGYADVLKNGVPILERLGVPATMFVTTRAVSDPSVFWWDPLARIVLQTEDLPGQLDLAVGNSRFRWEPNHALKAPEGGSPAEDRMQLHFALHAFLKPLPHSERVEALEWLAHWAGTDTEQRDCDRVMTPPEIQQFCGTEGFSIGAHTLTHPSLPLLTEEALVREVALSRLECEAIVGRSVRGFAYPFGDHNKEVIRVTVASGLDYAVTVESDAVHPGADLMRIPRIMVVDEAGDAFRRRVLAHG